MINFYNQVPSVYTNASRDFQYLSWLINVVLNAVKHNIDDMYCLPNVQGDIKLTEILAMTLGFKVKRNYDKTQLAAIVAILPSILRYKGTKKAILMAAEALVRATGSLGEAYVDKEGTEIRVTIPKDLVDITLFLDLLEYILPAGMTCRVIRKNEKSKKITDVNVKHKDFVNLLVVEDLSYANGNDHTQKAYLSSLYDFTNTQSTQDFTANIKKLGDTLALNAGLLDNNIIPVLADSRYIEKDPNLNTVVLYSREIDGTNKALLANDTVDGIQLRAKNTIQEL